MGHLDTRHMSVCLLCLLAAVHVLIFSAAFPFFNNVDEAIHFDLVLKYSHGQVPRGLETVSEESALYLSLYNSMAYFEQFAIYRYPPPPWNRPPQDLRQDLNREVPAWQAQTNYESSQPPLYYALAGLWWDFGQMLGLHDELLLYWLRFLNVPIVVALVWIACATTRLLFPDNLFLRLGVPSLIALLPQTTFYSIDNDVLSPLCFGAAFFCILKWFHREKPDARWAAATGLALAATGLAKMTNLPLLAVAGSFILFKLFQLFRRGKLRIGLPSMAAFLTCAGPPIIGWMIWSKIFFGDFTGSKLNIDHFGWTLKPFAEWWHHPIFTPAGLWTYLSGQFSTFWQGEFYWHNQPMPSPVMGILYTILSLALPAVTLVSLFQKMKDPAPLRREMLSFCFIILIAILGFFALISIIYDFHNALYPSRAHPYYHSGRLLLGALIPFLLLFVYGIDRLLSRFRPRIKFSALAAMMILMLITETAADWPAFFNDYNWFHM